MRPLITGSLAFDYILRVAGRFADTLPPTLGAGFSAAHTAPSLRRAFGGCAGNIAYGLKLLGEEPILAATVGEDFAPYDKYLHMLRIDRAHIKIVDGFFTAQAYIATDDDGSQLIFFHPGATAQAHRQSMDEFPSPALAIIAPNGREGMLQHGRDLARRKIPFIFDPGQAMGLFSPAELGEMTTLSVCAIFNRGEFDALQKTTGLCRERVLALTDAVIVTAGDQGSSVFCGGEMHRVAAAVLGDVADPTGCGDAYRAGVMYGLLRQWPWRHIIRFASVVAGKKVLHGGGQGYDISAAEAGRLCAQIYGEPPPAF